MMQLVTCQSILTNHFISCLYGKYETDALYAKLSGYWLYLFIILHITFSAEFL